MREQVVALEDLHRRKDKFLAMLSHELRNPLSPIASTLQLWGFHRQCSKEAGFDHHLVKPREFKKLQQILEALSEKKE